MISYSIKLWTHF